MGCEFNYSKLLGKIKEKGYTLKTFAKSIGISASTLSLKLSNKAHFTQREMHMACEILGIEIKNIGVYFFTQKV